MTTPFTKASACGNDFLIIEGRHAPASVAEFSKRICDRHHGVGADGVEWLSPGQDPTPVRSAAAMWLCISSRCVLCSER